MGRERDWETEGLDQWWQATEIWSFAAYKKSLSNQSRHIATSYFSLLVSYDGWSIRLGTKGKYIAATSCSRYDRRIKNICKLCPPYFFLLSILVVVAGGTPSWQHTQFWEWKFLGPAPSLAGGRLLSLPHEEQRGRERRRKHILSRLAIWMFTSLNATRFLVKRNSFGFNMISQTGNLAEHIDPHTSTVTVKQQNIKSVNLLHLVKKVNSSFVSQLQKAMRLGAVQALLTQARVSMFQVHPSLRSSRIWKSGKTPFQ